MKDTCMCVSGELKRKAEPFLSRWGCECGYECGWERAMEALWIYPGWRTVFTANVLILFFFNFLCIMYSTTCTIRDLRNACVSADTTSSDLRGEMYRRSAPAAWIMGIYSAELGLCLCPNMWVKGRLGYKVCISLH